jgi:hypothetical protein
VVIELWNEIEKNLVAKKAELAEVTKEDYNKLVLLAADKNLPEVTRDTLNEIISIVGPLIAGADLEFSLDRTSGAEKSGSSYKVKSAGRQAAGSSAALASLAHELTHVTVDQTFSNTFMMSIANADEVHIQEEGVHRTSLTNKLKATLDSLNPYLKGQKMAEVKSKLSYMSDTSQLLKYVDRAEKFPVESGVSKERSAEISGHIKTGKGNVGNNMVEYDAVITQLLVLMHEWKVPVANKFYVVLREVGKDIHDYRIAVAKGDAQGGRNR